MPADTANPANPAGPADLAGLAGVVEAAYGVGGGLIPIEGGYDTAAAVYRLGADHVLKVRKGRPYLPGVTIPTALADQGLRGVLAPIRTTDGRLWTSYDGLALTLYQYVEGNTAAATGLTPEQWEEFGALVRQVHDSAARSDDLPTERYVPKWGGAEHTWNDARTVIPLLEEHRDTFAALIDAAEKLAGELPELPMALCHADLHTYNLLVDPAGSLWLLDWDEVMLAPRERDLMFATGGGISRDLVTPEAERWFAAGYGPVELDDNALHYYRLAWAVQDIADFGMQAASGDRDAARMLAAVFQPGQIVDLTRTRPY